MNTIIVNYKGTKTGMLRLFLIMLSATNAALVLLLCLIGQVASVGDAIAKVALFYLIGLFIMAAGWFANKMMYT